jgi:glycosyltransferase involved in cell wall biosynthesis
MKKISVIMASYLGEYPNCATNREYKFKRAVESFLKQSYPLKELIIVSDGCDITERLYKENFKGYKNIVFKKLEKQPLFSGNVRNKGLEIASGDIICYLDTDDFIGYKHLANIVRQFNADWVYYDDFILKDFKSIKIFRSKVRYNKIESCRIGTSSIAHKRGIDAIWGDGYGHDWRFIKQLNDKYSHKKILHTGYIVCHIPKLVDL